MENRSSQVILNERIIKRIISLDEMYEKFEEDMKVKNLSLKTIAGYRGSIKPFIKYAKDLGIYNYNDLDLQVINKYIIDKTKNVSPENAKRFTKYYSIFIRCMEKYYPEIDISVLRKIGIPRVIKKEKFAYTDEDIENIYKVVNSYNTYFSIRFKVLITIMLQTGLRCNECLELRVDDILFDEDCIFVRAGKMKKQRKVPMPKTLKELLYKYIFEVRKNDIKNEYSNLLFLDQHNKPLTYNAIRIYVTRHIIPYVTFSSHRKWGFHQLRVKFATEYYMKTKNIQVLQYIMGHTTVQMTLHYVRMVDEKLFLTDAVEVNNYL